MFLKRTRLEVRSCFCKLTPKFVSELTPSLAKEGVPCLAVAALQGFRKLEGR